MSRKAQHDYYYLNIFAVETTMTACTILTTHSNYPLSREPEFKLTAFLYPTFSGFEELLAAMFYVTAHPSFNQSEASLGVSPSACKTVTDRAPAVHSFLERRVKRFKVTRLLFKLYHNEGDCTHSGWTVRKPDWC